MKIFAVIAVVLALLIPGTHAFAAWQVTTFEVYEGAPVKTEDWREQENPGAVGSLMRSAQDRFADEEGLDEALVRDIEEFLSATARRYSDMGFTDPIAANTLDSVVAGRDGEPVIRVYLSPVRGAGYAFYTSGKSCSEPPTPRKALNINTLGLKGERLRGTDYATLAHELFHAVMEASNFMRSDRCNRGGWITEGMSDAVSHHMARELRNADFRDELQPGQKLILKVLGARPYSMPLAGARPRNIDEAYFTSSFWRHLAELTAASRRAERHPGARPYAEDYRYLVDFLATEYPYGNGPAGEITWLDKTMRQHKHIRSGLAKVYAEFISAFSDFPAWRIDPQKKKLGYPPADKDRWISTVLGECEPTDPVNYDRPSNHELSIQRNAAACIFFSSAAGTNAGTVRILVASDDPAPLKQLRMGLPDGSLVSAPLLTHGKAESPMHIAEWNFPVLKIGDYLVISNMAEQPATTKPVDLTLQLSIDSWQSSMTPARPASNAREPAAPEGESTRREQQKRRTRRAIAKPLDNLKPVTRVARKLYGNECDEVRRRFNKCSSQLVISLSLSPLVIEENPLAAQTASGELFMESMSAQQGGGASAVQAQMQAGQNVDRYLRSIDASKITLRLPPLDYGFSGTLDNASIEVSRAGGDSYRSYGPRVSSSGQRISKPPNGSVTIAEYTPLVIRGTFRADLVDPDNPGPDIAPIVSRSISGAFLSASPYRLDREFDVDGDQVIQEGLDNSLRQTPFGAEVTTDIIRESDASAKNLCAQGVDDELLKKLGFSQGCGNTRGSVPADCSCDCERRLQEEQDPRCQEECRRPWKDCPLWEGEFPADLEGQVRVLREMMDRQGLPAEMQEVMVESFRQAPEQARVMMLESYR